MTVRATPSRGVSLGTRLSKLRAMSAGEIAERLRYKAVLVRERREHQAGRLAPEGRLQTGLRPDLRAGDWRRGVLHSRTGSAALLLPGVHVPDAMRALFDTRYRSERDDMRLRAADARAHRFAFFGQTFEYGEHIPWQDDPVTGAAWPAVYHVDVPVHRGNSGHGDVKHVWELSRQQYLIDLGKSVFLDQDTASLTALVGLVRSWIAGNPYATGVNWACALEPAFRSFSWLWAYALSWRHLDDEFHLEWLCGFYDHARFIEQHLEHYSSPYNHLLGEAAALYMIGATFPEFAHARRWRATAVRVLETRLPQQFYRDGGTVEQSTFYHHASVGDYLLAALTARQVGEELSPAVWTAIERGIDFSMALMQPDGRIPEIGGADDGKPIRMEHLPLWDFRPYQAIGAVLFRRGDLKTAAGRFHEDAVWLLGPSGLEAFDALAAQPPAQLSTALPHSGYYVMRSNWSPAADYVCFDCGEQAAGMRPDAVPNSMHGHADCLSVVVALRGRRVLVDSGFYAYNCGGDWEAHFRETAAHNTARVDGRDQALHLGSMAWSHSYRASAEGWWTEGAEAWAIGSHDGYDRGPDRVRHRRAVWLRASGYVVLCDEFTGRGQHDLEVNFQFAPGPSLVALDDAFVFGDIAAVSWAGDGSWEAEASQGGDGPDQGWIAPSLGCREAAPRLSLRRRSDARRTVLLTVVAPLSEGGPALSVRRAEGAAALTVHGDSFVDHVAMAADTTGAERSLVTIRRVTDDGATNVVHVPNPKREAL